MNPLSSTLATGFLVLSLFSATPLLHASSQPDLKRDDSVSEAVAPSRVRVRAQMLDSEGGKPIPSRWNFYFRGGEEVFEFEQKEEFELPAGAYIVSARQGEKMANISLTIPSQKTPFEITLIQGVSRLNIELLDSKRADSSKATFTIYEQTKQGGRGKKVAEGRDRLFTLTPGDFIIEAASGEAKVEERVSIKLAETVHLQTSFDKGQVDFQSLLNGEPLREVNYVVFKDEGEGKQGEAVLYSDHPRVSLLAGNYTVTAYWGENAKAETLFTVEAGKVTSSEVNFLAGRVALSVAGGSAEGVVHIVPLDPWAQGEEHVLVITIPKTTQTYALANGKYKIELRMNNGHVAVQEIEVKTGQTIKVNLSSR